jgi:hypothetical protein
MIEIPAGRGSASGKCAKKNEPRGINRRDEERDNQNVLKKVLSNTKINLKEWGKGE